MTFTAYIQRQKSLIRSRNDRETAVLVREEEVHYDTKKLLEDLASFKGLNTAERQRYSKMFSHA